jgi:hypothetical protein
VLVEATRFVAADTARIVFQGADPGELEKGRRACAHRLVAAALRPWPTPSDDRWTVRIVLTDAGATAYRLSAASARDAIDAGLAPLVTEDLDLVAYAAARPELDVTPLPWDRTYLHVSPGGDAPLGIERASDAVRVDARPAEFPSCDTIRPAAVPPTVLSWRVVHEVGDRTARELAERVVAVTGDARAAAVGLGADEFEAALRAGNELGYIVSVSRFAGRECVDLATLAQHAPWLAPHSALPLVETRTHVIAPRGSPP